MTPVVYLVLVRGREGGKAAKAGRESPHGQSRFYFSRRSGALQYTGVGPIAGIDACDRVGYIGSRLEYTGMTSLLVKNATLVVSMDDAGSQWADGGLYIEDNVIRQVGPTAELPASAVSTI